MRVKKRKEKVNGRDNKSRSISILSSMNLKLPANKGLVKILYTVLYCTVQCTCLVSIYVFSEMKLLFPKQNYNVSSPSSYTHISVRDLYISMIGLSILLQGNMWTSPGNI
jgi:hypothetical protein